MKDSNTYARGGSGEDHIDTEGGGEEDGFDTEDGNQEDGFDTEGGKWDRALSTRKAVVKSTVAGSTVLTRKVVVKMILLRPFLCGRVWETPTQEESGNQTR